MSEQANPGRWLRALSGTESATRALVCFPYGGAPASCYRPLAQHLAPTISVLSIQYPGRQDRAAEPPCQMITELARGAATAIAAAPLESAVFFGHCMGALVAFETARLLSGTEISLDALVVSGVQAPHLVGVDLRDATEERIRSDIGSLGGTDARILADPDMMEVFLPALRADYLAVDRYEHMAGDPLSCPVLALHGTKDPRVSERGIAGWGTQTTDQFGTRALPGEHFYFVEDPAELARIIGDVCTSDAGAVDVGRKVV